MASRFASNIAVLLAGFLLVCTALGRPRLHAPRLEAWLAQEDTALDSPALAAAIRDEPTLPLPAVPPLAR